MTEYANPNANGKLTIDGDAESITVDGGMIMSYDTAEKIVKLVERLMPDATDELPADLIAVNSVYLFPNAEPEIHIHATRVTLTVEDAGSFVADIKALIS